MIILTLQLIIRSHSKIQKLERTPIPSKGYGFMPKVRARAVIVRSLLFFGYLGTFMLHRKWKNETDSFALFMQSAADLYCGNTDFDTLNPTDFVEKEEKLDV